MAEGWSVVIAFIGFCVAMILVAAHLAVHTQAVLAAENDRTWLVDALVWLNRHLPRFLR